MKIPFVDLNAQHAEIKKELNQVIKRVIEKSDFILGEEVRSFEKEFADYIGTKFVVGVNSGTDALFLGLSSLGIGKGDEVIVPAFTYIATAFAVTFTDARPKFVDINEDTYNIDVNNIKKAISKRTKAIIPVHLYGQPADMGPILRLADKYGLKVIEDAAQAHGAEYRFQETSNQSRMKRFKEEILRDPEATLKKSLHSGKPVTRKVGSIGDIGCFSFYPTKNLGACGDGGMVVTNNKKIYKRLFMLRNYGRRDRYNHLVLGYNSRLDTVQAAILRLKLQKLDKWNNMRRQNAKIYNKYLKDCPGLVIPKEEEHLRHVYHIYAIRVKNRDKTHDYLRQKGIGVLIHYPIPLHLQPAYRNLGYRKGDFPISEKIANEVISLPMFPHLKIKDIEYVSHVLKDIYAR